MLKNVKIDEETHRKLSVAAAQMGVQKGLLCATLIRAALELVPEEQLRRIAEKVPTGITDS
jgi:hypothetical protein